MQEELGDVADAGGVPCGDRRRARGALRLRMSVVRCARSWCSGIRTSCVLGGTKCGYKRPGMRSQNKEKGRTTLADELGTVPVTLPALMRAQTAAEACRPLRDRAVCAGNGTAGFAGSTGRLEPGTGRTGGGENCCLLRPMPCGWQVWTRRSADLCIQALLCRTAGAERTKRYSGRVTCSDREKKNTK